MKCYYLFFLIICYGLRLGVVRLPFILYIMYVGAPRRAATCHTIYCLFGGPCICYTPLNIYIYMARAYVSLWMTSAVPAILSEKEVI